MQARLTGVDWVRHEVAQAIRLRAASLADPARAQALRVIPVLIGGATPPPEDQVPAEIAPLCRLSMMPFDESSEGASINTLLERIQGETFEEKARRLQLEAERRDAKLLLQVHDELVLEVAEGDLALVEVLVRREMERAAELKVPLEVEVGSGRSWAEAH